MHFREIQKLKNYDVFNFVWQSQKRVNAIIAIKVESNIMNQSIQRLQQFEIGYLLNLIEMRNTRYFPFFGSCIFHNNFLMHVLTITSYTKPK